MEEEEFSSHMVKSQLPCKFQLHIWFEVLKQKIPGEEKILELGSNLKTTVHHNPVR